MKWISPVQMRASVSSLRRGLIVLGLILLGTTSGVQAQPTPLDDAIRTYNEARYDEAIEQFTAIARDSTTNKDTRVLVLQYLGRAYVANNLLEEARQAIEKLLDLAEPPPLEMDPDVEPLPLIRMYYDVRKERKGNYEVELRDSTLKTVAVIDFTNSAIGPDATQYDGWRLGLAAMMINYLSGAIDLKVIERERLHWLLDELGLGGSGSVDEATAVQLGKLLGAQTVLIGNFIVTPKHKMFVGARLVSVETGEVLLSEQEQGKEEKFYELMETLSEKMAEAMNAHLPKATLGARRQSSAFDAMMSYSEGLLLLEQRDYQGAYDKFQEALQFDPDYEKARQKAESVKPMLG